MAVAAAEPVEGYAPLEVCFDGSGSYDPEEADLLYHRPGTLFIPFKAPVGLEQTKIISSQRLARETDVLHHREIGENIGDLERTADTQMRRAMQRQVGDVTPFENDLTAGWLEIAA